MYFKDRILTERLLIVDNIYKSLNDPLIKLIFLFMDCILPKFTSLNSFFQSSNVVITQLHDKIVLTYKEIVLLYMNPNYIKTTPINDINPEKSDKFLPKSQIYMGIKKEMQKNSIFNNKT